jgi:UPF0716 protein FxsA
MSPPGHVPPAPPVVHPGTGPRPPVPSWRVRAVRVALLAWPVVELAVLIEVGTRLGVWLTLLLLLTGGVAGVLVLRAVGAAAIRRLTAQARPPGAVPPSGRPGAETALVVLAGLLLIVPGLLSDVAGGALLLPPVRRRLARRIGDAVLRRLSTRSTASIRVVRGQVLPDDRG